MQSCPTYSHCQAELLHQPCHTWCMPSGLLWVHCFWGSHWGLLIEHQKSLLPELSRPFLKVYHTWGCSFFFSAFSVYHKSHITCSTVSKRAFSLLLFVVFFFTTIQIVARSYVAICQSFCKAIIINNRMFCLRLFEGSVKISQLMLLFTRG